jgi:hypothetical protein
MQLCSYLSQWSSRHHHLLSILLPLHVPLNMHVHHNHILHLTLLPGDISTIPRYLLAMSFVSNLVEISSIPLIRSFVDIIIISISAIFMELKPVYKGRLNQLSHYKDEPCAAVPPMDFSISSATTRAEFINAFLRARNLEEFYTLLDGSLPAFVVKCFGSGPNGYPVNSDKEWTSVVDAIFRLSSGRRKVTVIIHKNAIKSHLNKVSSCCLIF